LGRKRETAKENGYKGINPKKKHEEIFLLKNEKIF